jgi:hypothetical protein
MNDSTGHALSVSITPGVSMLAVLGSLNYKPWFALAEYVDNALQSFLSNDETAESGPLVVRIEMRGGDGGEVVISDNAWGIPLSEFPRAFRPAEVPLDRSGLSEFGMGMKSASCWFARKWSVTTTVEGEPVARVVTFDIEQIVANDVQTLEVSEVAAEPSAHGTVVRLWDLNQPLATRTVSKIREHLTDIYRVFLRDEQMVLIFRDEQLFYEDPAVLVSPPFDEPESSAISWRKEVDFDFGAGLRVHGFAALLAAGKQSQAGFSLFRRGRVIEGTADELYKPGAIYGAGNTYRSQRLFGELHLEGFEVSHTKDGFQWLDSESAFLELLHDELDSAPVMLLRQAEGFRARASRREQKALVEGAIDRTVRSLKGLPSNVDPGPDEEPPPSLENLGATLYQRELDVPFRGISWRISVEAREASPGEKWMTYSSSSPNHLSREVHISLNLAHPFLVRFAQKDDDAFEATLRVGIAIAIADAIGRMDVLPASAISRVVNELLSGALANPK